MRIFKMVTSYTAWKQDTGLPAVSSGAELSLSAGCSPHTEVLGQFPLPAALSIQIPPNQCFSAFARHGFFMFPLSSSFHSTFLTAAAPQHQGEFIP